MYELEIYQKESRKFPQRGTKVICEGTNQNGIVSSYNIMTREVVMRTPDGVMFRVPVSAIKVMENQNSLEKVA